MLTEVDISLFFGGAVIALVSWFLGMKRGPLWIGVAALSYINATIAWRCGLPYAEAITGVGDSCVCLAVYFWGREQWEMLIWRLFQISVAISFFYLAGNLGVFLSIPHVAYSVMMEAVNWLLLLIILGTAILQRLRAGGNVGAQRSWNRLRDFALALRAQRTRVPFHRVPR